MNHTIIGVDIQIIYFLYNYKYYGDYDYNLFKIIVVNFLNQTKGIFKLTSTDVNRRFCNFLRENGVYVLIDKLSIASNLVDVVNKEELPTQLLEEL